MLKELVGSLKPRGSQVRQVVSENAINSPTYKSHNSRTNRFYPKKNHSYIKLFELYIRMIFLSPEYIVFSYGCCKSTLISTFSDFFTGHIQRYSELSHIFMRLGRAGGWKNILIKILKYIYKPNNSFFGLSHSSPQVSQALVQVLFVSD